jgi:hypothetical protein
VVSSIEHPCYRHVCVAFSFPHRDRYNGLNSQNQGEELEKHSDVFGKRQDNVPKLEMMFVLELLDKPAIGNPLIYVVLPTFLSETKTAPFLSSSNIFLHPAKMDRECLAPRL